MGHLWRVVCLLLLAATATAQDAMPSEAPKALARRIATALECGRSENKRDEQVRVHREWCAAAGIKDEVLVVPRDRRLFLGLSIGIAPQEDILAAVRRRPHLALLTIDEHGALVTSLPDSDALKPMAALASLNLLVKGHAKRKIYVSPELLHYIKRYRHTRLHRLQPEGRAGRFEAIMTSHIYSVEGTFGKGYVVLEQDSSGTRVNLFPIVPMTSG